METIDELRAELNAAKRERDHLRQENARLKACPQYRIGDSDDESEDSVADIKKQRSGMSPPEKVTLFRSYFRGRDDVYALRWESRKGIAGYSPACAHEWDRWLCGKPKIKCGECSTIRRAASSHS